jgi:hypothetical protein
MKEEWLHEGTNALRYSLPTEKIEMLEYKVLVLKRCMWLADERQEVCILNHAHASLSHLQ